MVVPCGSPFRVAGCWTHSGGMQVVCGGDGDAEDFVCDWGGIGAGAYVSNPCWSGEVQVHWMASTLHRDRKSVVLGT